MREGQGSGSAKIPRLCVRTPGAAITRPWDSHEGGSGKKEPLQLEASLDDRYAHITDTRQFQPCSKYDQISAEFGVRYSAGGDVTRAGLFENGANI
ncbi:hypothetical protein VTO73DRAFT_2258 [Trametes versicolor]